MKWRPLLFSGEMVRALLDGRKWQTRRLNGLKEVNDRPDEWHLQDLSVDPLIDFARGPRVMKGLIATFEHEEYGDCFINVRCPWGQVGDGVWVKETWKTEARYDHLPPSQVPDGSNVLYMADGAGQVNTMGYPFGKVRQSIFMQQRFSRLERELVGIRLERVQETSYEDALAEGVHNEMNIRWMSGDDTLIGLFGNLWDSINEKRGYGWEKNPWVWVLEFPH